MDIKIGADPEFFLKTKDGTPISAHDLVPGNKQKPHKLIGGAVQADGTAVEFNIEPASNAQEFKNNIELVLAQIRAMIPNELEFSFTPAIRYEENYFDSLPEFSKELGCDPDFSAFFYPIKPNPRPQPTGRNKTLRTGAGHIHVGFTEVDDPMDESHTWDCTAVCLAIDSWLGMFNYRWDDDEERSKLYGANCPFRPKKYGVEYRAPSNAWLNYPKLWPWLFDTVVGIVNFLKETGQMPCEYLKMRDRKFLTARDILHRYTLHYERDYYLKYYRREWERARQLNEERLNEAIQKANIGIPPFPLDFAEA